MPIMPIGNNNQQDLMNNQMNGVNPQIEIVAGVANGAPQNNQQNNHFSYFADVGNQELQQNNDNNMVYAYGDLDHDNLVQTAYATLYEAITGEPYNNANNNQ